MLIFGANWGAGLGSQFMGGRTRQRFVECLRRFEMKKMGIGEESKLK